jgi:putative ABC transport system substrate-binding protein
MPVTTPVKLGLVQSIARPGTNMTGIAFGGDVREHGKSLEIFKEIVPALRAVAITYDIRHPVAEAVLGVIRRVAKHLRLRLREIPVRTIAQAAQAIANIQEDKPNGIYVVCSSIFADFAPLATIARRRQLPLHSCTSEAVRDGQGLFAYARDLYAIGRRGAWYVDRILKGSRPESLLVEIPTKFELVINLKIATRGG